MIKREYEKELRLEKGLLGNEQPFFVVQIYLDIFKHNSRKNK